MSTAWNGPDPIEVADLDDYELGTEFRAEVDITITHVRVWAGAGEVNRPSREARIWSSGGGQLGVAPLPDDLPTGWSLHALTTPVVRLAAQRFIVSYSTGGNYAALTHGLDIDVVSADGAVTALGFAGSTNGNGVFNASPETFPATSNGLHNFYGADVQYSLGVGGNTAPRLTATASTDDLTTTVTAVPADDETLVGATLRFIWGDDSADSVVAYPTVLAQHTYALEGNYAVAVILTDAGGLTDTAAVVATARAPITGGVIEQAMDELTDALRAALPNQYRVVQFGRPAEPPSFVVGAPALTWEGTCAGDPTVAQFPIFVVERFDDRAFDRLRLVIPRVALAIDNVQSASVINASPSIYPGSSVELPCYIFTVEVSL